MDANLDRAKVLTEALPYIQQYNGKIVVINCGGVPMTDTASALRPRRL